MRARCAFKVQLCCSNNSIIFIPAALNLYADKGENDDVVSRISVLLEKNDQEKGMLQAPAAKKGRSKLAAEWLTALVEGKPFPPPDSLQNGTVPGRESEAEKKRKSLTEAGASAKKKSRSDLEITTESILANPKAYVGRRVAKFFDGDGLFFGRVSKYKPRVVGDGEESQSLWKIVYDDSDKEEFDVGEMVAHLKMYEANAAQDPNPSTM